MTMQAKLVLAKDRKVTAVKHESRQTGKIIKIANSSWCESEHRKIELEGLVTVTIDLEAIIKRWGAKAIRSKGKRAQEADGSIVVTARDVREVASSNWCKLA